MTTGKVMGYANNTVHSGTGTGMYPLLFTKFYREMGPETQLSEIDLYGGSDLEDYRNLEKSYQVYRHIGGCLQVVTTYLKTRNQADCMDVLGDLVQTFGLNQTFLFQ